MKDNFWLFLIVFSLGCGLAVSCGGDDSTDPADAASDAASAATGGEADNGLIKAYPGSLAISVFSETEATSLALNTSTTATVTKTLKAKKAEANKILDGSGDSCTPAIFNANQSKESITCYEFDQDMIFGTSPNGNSFGTRNGKAKTGEACLVAFARSKAVEVEDMVDRALGFIQSMMCQAKKDSKDVLPAEGETLDLATELGAGMGSKVSSVTTATLKRLSDQNSRPVYRIDIVVKDGTETRETHLVHSPASETDNTTYNGVLWSKITGFKDPFGGGGPGGNQPKDPHISVQYAMIKNSDDSLSLQAELLRGNVAESLSANAFSKGVLDLNVGASFTGSSTDQNYGQYKKSDGSNFNNNEAVTAMTYIGFNLNPDDDTGTVSYWQNPGSNYKEDARGMVFSLGKDTTSGQLKGCGISGAARTTGAAFQNGVSIRRSKKEGLSLEASGFLHPFAHTEINNKPNCNLETGNDSTGDFFKLPKNGCDYTNEVKWYKPLPTGLDSSLVTTWTTKQAGSVVMRQCVSQATSGTYEIDSSIITADAGFELLDGSDLGDKKVILPLFPAFQAWMSNSKFVGIGIEIEIGIGIGIGCLRRRHYVYILTFPYHWYHPDTSFLIQ